MPLIVVATPLGNLGDVTLRALEALREAELIVAEDTRVARRLLNALAIGAKELWSYREQNASGATAGILARARDQRVVLVSDAGMPGISDPGSELIAAAHANGIAVDVLPGPSASLGVAVLSGFPLRRFVFEGFPPRASSARRAEFERALRAHATTIWYESPQRIHDALADLAAVAPDARVFLVREYTKRFEQQLAGTPAGVGAALAQPVRGEIAFAVAPYAPQPSGEEPALHLDAEIARGLAAGTAPTELARALAKRGLGERRALYKRITERKPG